MYSSPFDLPHDDANPLDMVEELATAQGWNFSRHDECLMSLKVKGDKTTYEVSLEWQDEFAALLFACSMPIEITDQYYETATRALEQINQNLWMGHFDLSNKGKYPTYRYTLLARMMPGGISVEMMHDIFDIAIAESNRFYTTFQLVQAGDVRLQDNLAAAVFETLGEA
ncbi:MAG: YbjN domain-containing protein [Alphaproteobacteria bacterium]|nr:YbjN domain-containing protein [Alphaproteobacteria bacterium]